MPEVKSYTEKDGKVTASIEFSLQEISDDVQKEAVKMLATGLGNEIIVNHMKTLTTVFTEQFRELVVRMVNKSLTETLKEIEKEKANTGGTDAEK